ncbi:aspartyl-phosphate phosphatase Spo0E family protein [Brevibacillus porteri]|uniref:Aspartyl-phosphate phosphatase Spo0E family protein n=1 Tax=Brevibacillus porteri TaxID=2126350 RepID=A0ABX5FLF1_9BACL|nr:aspartyl-phosphate phosphatase Spo0E family protein [Brevibacillus porteri]MED1800821.1 aspartyl-phosphate phosphatase Spo0E family protein [Brevibacillus porteri]MED2132579.1 aspartyl-phosphate phosphatase Spo0E family protein [Brevibacillus porteri]MED2747673.1 aspartyl-phosphate phosphatase Spo0E family protein [Brevibacillus porteri]MED2818241.1 aspartyl-phosphate phosphatase Spo0E family protein [Brevibacillus porteri]MED2894696.1 aspartyl-phosphate phosphatase Spo0E family protein [Br
MVEWQEVSNEDLTQIIKNLQYQLKEVFKQQGKLTDSDVLKISRELDEYILECQRRNLTNQKGGKL